MLTQSPSPLDAGLTHNDNKNEPEIIEADSRNGLSDIKIPDVQMVLWQRTLSNDLQAWLDNLDVSCLPYLRVLLTPKELRFTMNLLLDECGMPKDRMRAYLIDDIERLVSMFADVTESELVDVRFESLDDDGCRKFHRDFVETRLLTSYRGPATEWIKPQHAAAALKSQEQYQGPIEHFQTGEVGIFKGSRDDLNSGIVHRSPPIAGSGHTRLLLCLNQESEASPERWS